ncbi:MAG: inorganic phosphate transporter [Pseudomonadota bacterium]
MKVPSLSKVEKVAAINREELFRFGAALLFVVGIMLFTIVRTEAGPQGVLLVVAAMIGGYMAMNIGANDVANNVGPAVGSRAITLSGAIIIAAIFESSGAIIAGGDVVGTIKRGIIDPALIDDRNTFIWLMIAALLAAALWLNFATAIGAPVSTTHSIVGGVLGAGVAAGGWGIADWQQTGAIAASWVISPVMGGAIAAAFLYLIKRTISYQDDVLAAARKMVPLLVALMAWAFSAYLILKGLKHLWKVPFGFAALYALGAAIVVYLVVRPLVQRAAEHLPNDKAGVNELFTIPLIFAAALLSFAHGANDVANAVGPLAGINEAIVGGAVAAEASIPLWIMLVGALGISLGLALYGPKLIRTVGSEITELDKTRAFCIALAAAITVLIASQLGLPVSSTHIAVGGVFGVGFLREYLKVNYSRMIDEIKQHHEGDSPEAVDAFLHRFEAASVQDKGIMLSELKRRASPKLYKSERKNLRRMYRLELVKRSLLLRIAAAWVITVPFAGLMGGIFFFTIRGMMLP